MKKIVVLLVLLAGMWQGAVVKAANYDTAWVRQTQDIFSISFHPSSQFFAVGGGGLYAGIWDVNTATEIKKYSGYPSGNVYFSETGKYLVQANDYGFRVYNFLNDSLIFAKDSFPNSYKLKTAISKDEKLFATGENNSFTIWNLETGTIVAHIDTVVKLEYMHDMRIIKELAFSKDGEHIAVAMSANEPTSIIGRLVLINLKNDSVDFEYPIGRYEHIEYSHDGTKIAFTSADSGEAIKVMDVNTKQIVATIPGIAQSVDEIIFSHNDRYLIYTYGQIIVWDMVQNKIFRTYPGGFHQISISNDSKYIAGGIAFYLFLNNFNGIDNINELNSIKATLIYPNPADNALMNLTFDLEKPNITSINLYDLQGKTVKVNENRYLPEGHYLYPIDVSSIPNGSYFLKITSGSFSFSQSIIVNK